MRQITTAALILGMAASAFAAKPAAKPKITAADKKCAAACTAHMKAKGMKGSCPASMCASGQCPMMAKAKTGKGAKPPMKH